jgi:hypothetical protein
MDEENENTSESAKQFAEVTPLASNTAARGSNLGALRSHNLLDRRDTHS